VRSLSLLSSGGDGVAQVVGVDLTWSAPTSGGQATGTAITLEWVAKADGHVILSRRQDVASTTGGRAVVDYGAAPGLQDDAYWRFRTSATGPGGTSASSAPATALAPALVGTKSWDAYRLGRAAGATLDTAQSDAKAEDVVAQRPAAGTALASGGTVVIVVSSTTAC
jgi:hypothetical protein